MAQYFLSYDLIKEKDYKKMYVELAKFKAVRVLESLFCFQYEDDKTRELLEYFAQFIDEDDKLIVLKTSYWAGVSLLNNPHIH